MKNQAGVLTAVIDEDAKCIIVLANSLNGVDQIHRALFELQKKVNNICRCNYISSFSQIDCALSFHPFRLLRT